MNWMQKIIDKGKKIGKLHPEEINEMLPDEVRSEEDVEHAVDEILAAGVKIDPETPEPGAHCVIEIAMGPNKDSGKIEFVTYAHRDPSSRGVGDTFQEAIEDMVKNIRKVLPELDGDTDSFTRLIRGSRLREILRTLREKE